jgi:hypothetical protein
MVLVARDGGYEYDEGSLNRHRTTISLFRVLILSEKWRPPFRIARQKSGMWRIASGVCEGAGR